MATTTNRSYTYPDENDDNWFAVFVALMDAIDVDVAAIQPGALTADIKIKKSSPAVRLTDSTSGDYQIVVTGDTLIIQRNSGTESVPIWTTYIEVQADGDVKLPVVGKGLIVRDVGDNNDYRIGVQEVKGEPVLFVEPV